MLPDRPLEAAEIHAIDKLLHDLGASRWWTIGLFVSVFVGPDHVAPSTWLTKVMGDAPFATKEQGQRTMQMLTMLYNDVGRSLAADPANVVPPADEDEAVADFASGMFEGAKLHPRWLAEHEGLMLMVIFGALAGVVPDEELVEAEGEEEKTLADPAAWKKEERGKLAQRVAETRAFFAGKRTVPRVNTAAKTGRNDPCPCGSGKKYKKCHGADA
ncbi:MAG TPA: UPF0149 family protein [Polyangiaceae bacterium]